MSKLATIIVEVLEVGGPRKRTILLALARSHGSSAQNFTRTMNGLVRTRRVERFQRYGGTHYRLAR